MTNTHTATFTDGTTVTRRSAAVYRWASRRAGTVRWHKTADGARRAAGRQGQVVQVDTTTGTGAQACVVCGGTGKVGSRSAVTGQVTWTTCWRCGGSGVKA